MLREMMIGKLHRGAVTGCELEYPGSLTVDIELIERAGMLVNQRIQLLNSNNGYRLETYLIPGERGKRQIIVNGAAARHAQLGDRVIIVAYGLCSEADIATLTPKVIALDERNQIVATY